MNAILIGLGMVADTHAAALAASDKLDLIGVVGRDPSRAERFAARHGIATIFPDLAAALSDPRCDFAIIATPPDARIDIVKACIAAGKPILMEKPIERSFDSAAHIVALCKDAGLSLGIVLQHRARTASQALKRLLESGALGKISHIDIRVPWWRDQSYYNAPGRGTYSRDGGGVMLTQAIHSLDLALWLLGPARSVMARMHTTPLHQLEAEDWASAILEFESGAVGSLMASTADYPGSAESLRIQGTLGAAYLEGGVLSLSYLDGRSETIGAAVSTGGGADPMAFTHDWHQSVIEDFADSLQTQRAPLASGSSALHAHAVIDAMERSSASGQCEKVRHP